TTATWHADEPLGLRNEPAAVKAGPAKKTEAKLADLGIGNDDCKPKTDTVTETAPPATPAPTPAPATSQQPSTLATQQPVYAQLLSTFDQKVADALAAKLIDGGFTSAYVERGPSEKGTLFKVRVKFPSEGEARAAEAKLREFSK